MVKEKSSTPTLEDVATRAGVSVATVSRVITSSSPVSQELELRVKQAMEDLGFEPRRSRAKRNKPVVIAFIAPELDNPALNATIAGAEDEAEKLDLCVAVLNIPHKPEIQHHNLKLLKHFSFNGVIVLHDEIEPDDIFELQNDPNLSVVILNRIIESSRVHCINTDRETGMYQATKYLLSLNHRKIAYISGPPDWELSKARLQGIQRALTEANISLDPQFQRWGFPTIDAGFQVTSSLLQQPPEKRPTAILAFNDLMAIGTLHAIRSFGLVVPNDISVVGFDDNYFTAHTNPPLTTVSQPKYQIGQLAVRKIHDNLEGYDTERGGFTLLECPFVVRESTGPCKHVSSV
jgi:LacI family repressor for deo operon, udp, cdd, tsx, nupC, and nupG